MRFRAYDKVGNAEQVRLRHVEVEEEDDTLVVPPLDPSLPATVTSSAAFLYTGPDAVQTGVEQGAIEAQRTGILQGRVLAEDGTPLAGVTVTLLDHPELGQTVTRENGRYDLAVNGGAALVVDFHKDGYVDAQRTVDVGWQEYAEVDDVALVAFDAKVTEIDLESDEPIQTARGTTRADRDGSRQATVMFRQGTHAKMQLPDGSQQELDTLHIRATEYTVGEHGAERMPAALPPTSGYTYAVELSADEAVAANADSIKFDKPVAFYLENFLEFNVGSAVPVGWYDRSRGVWVPEPNGRVVAVVGETNGRADINLDRDAARRSRPLRRVRRHRRRARGGRRALPARPVAVARPAQPLLAARLQLARAQPRPRRRPRPERPAGARHPGPRPRRPGSGRRLQAQRLDHRLREPDAGRGRAASRAPRSRCTTRATACPAARATACCASRSPTATRPRASGASR